VRWPGTGTNATPRQSQWQLAAAWGTAIVGPRRGRLAGSRERVMRSRVVLLEGKAGAGVHHRRAPGVDGGNDLVRGDSLQVGAGRGQMRVPQLALDQWQRDPLTQELDSMRMTELVGREAAPDARLNRDLVELQPGGAGRPGMPAVGPAITQNNGPTGSVARSASHGPRAVHPHASIPTWRRRSFLPCLTKTDPRRSSRSVSVSDSASLIRNPARHSTTINPLRRLPYRACAARRMTAMISSTVGGSAA